MQLKKIFKTEDLQGLDSAEREKLIADGLLEAGFDRSTVISRRLDPLTCDLIYTQGFEKQLFTSFKKDDPPAEYFEPQAVEVIPKWGALRLYMAVMSAVASAICLGAFIYYLTHDHLIISTFYMFLFVLNHAAFTGQRFIAAISAISAAVWVAAAMLK